MVLCIFKSERAVIRISLCIEFPSIYGRPNGWMAGWWLLCVHVGDDDECVCVRV